MYGIESLLTGRTLVDRYRIEEVIGRGGMGAVYRATDERLGRQVAVKVIAVAAPGPEAHARLRARFHREARAAAGLRHPNVVAVYDFGTDDPLELDFLVMEFLRGEDLASRLAREGPLPLPLTLRILWQAARGLAAGHRADLIHRDVKPGNLYLEEGDHPDEIHVRVLDFGIAEITADEETLTHLTVFGRSPFSPAYASPEQLRGEDRLTPATDVFSLGAVGYHLVTGHRAFTSSDPERMSAELTASLAALRARAPLLSSSMRAVLERALAHQPRDRFSDADAFSRALEPALTARPAEPAPRDAVRWVEPKPRAQKPKSRATSPPRFTRSEGTMYMESTATHAAAEPPKREPKLPRPDPIPPRAPAPRPASIGPAAPPTAEKRPGLFRRMCSAVWNFCLTIAAVGLLVGTWTVSAWGLWAYDHEVVYGAVAASVLLAPFAVHRVRGRRGSYGLALVASAAASIGAVFLVGPEGEPHHLLGAVFALQLVASLAADRFSRHKDRPAPEPEHTTVRI